MATSIRSAAPHNQVDASGTGAAVNVSASGATNPEGALWALIPNDVPVKARKLFALAKFENPVKPRSSRFASASNLGPETDEVSSVSIISARCACVWVAVNTRAMEAAR